MVKRHGTDLAFAQMMHARNFKNDKNYRATCVDWDDYTHTSGKAHDEAAARALDSPLIVQLAGDDPDVLVEAGRFVHHDVAAIDLNLGCPQKIAKRGNYGAYLLPNKALIVSLLTAMVKGLDCPITAKIRRLSSDEETIELAQAIEACGVQMLTIHGRTVESSKLFTGPCDWDIIKKVKASVSIPVVANGGISCRQDALQCLEETGADAVMSSEALLENPKLFSEEGDRLFREDYVKAQFQTCYEYLEIVQAHRLPRPLFQVVRSHIFKFMYRLIDAPSNHDLRDKLATGSLQEMIGVIDTLSQRLSQVDYDTKVAEERGLIGKTHWYMRHRDDRAAKRVLSTPKKAIFHPATIARQAEKASDNLAPQLELKQKLLAKKREREQSISSLHKQ